MAEQDFLGFGDFLETQPQALYQSFLSDPETTMSPAMRRYYQNQFNQIQGEYIGELARQMRRGKLPTRTFENFLSQDVFDRQIRGNDPASRLSRLTGYDRFRRESPYARSGYGAGPMGQRMFAPSARWITY